MATDWRAAERAAPTSPQAEDALVSSTAPFDLTSPTGPWVVFAPTGDTHVARQLDALRDAGGIVRRLDARAMSTPETLFRTFARELAFPGYFGHNWNALADCLKDLHGDWHGNADVAIVIEHADLLWTRSYLPLFVAVLCDTAEQANLALDADGLPNGNPGPLSTSCSTSRPATCANSAPDSATRTTSP